jgi:hypothetical protein
VGALYSAQIMETHTLNPAERLIILMDERRSTLGGDRLHLLFWDLLTCLVRLFGSLADWGPQQQACSDVVGPATPSCAEVASVGRPQGLRTVRDGGPITPRLRTARDEGGVHAACARRPRERRHPERRDRAAIARAVGGLACGRRVLAGRFAKMGLRGWGDLRVFGYDLAIMADCCRA